MLMSHTLQLVYMQKKQYLDLPVGFNPPVFDGAIPANPSAAKPAKGFLVKLICLIGEKCESRSYVNTLHKERENTYKIYRILLISLN